MDLGLIMRIIKDTTEFKIEEKTAVAIGKFDGFHRGHQKLLQEMQKQKEKGLATVVFTFVPSPAAFFNQGSEPIRELNTIEEKRRIFEQANIDYLIEYPFYQEIADMLPEVYIEKVLVEQMHAVCIVDNGGHVLDVSVEHDLYGQISVDLIIHNRADVQEFVEKMKNSSSKPLKELTSGLHYHTVEAKSQEILDRIENKLKEEGFLVP